ncbi:CotH kinase family protein [Sunxiuqinia sp. A32]|uniref:CotH kinase family protein n=1 Tax=Sunxiuqinia sp. A32 TaxID=3461496 RepID=UPI004045A608
MKKLRTFLLITATALSFSLSAQTFQGFGESNLPLVSINTGGQAIPDEPKINAQMGIIWNGPGLMNSSSDPFNDFEGSIAIETRGSSSQMFPKKSYGLELRDEAGQDTSLSLVGMPKEEDWILYAPYSDKSLIRNVLTYTLDASLGHYSPRCRFVELFLNGSYQGVYVLMEKIKHDNERVDIATLLPGDIEGVELTGGYILKIDKTTGNGGEGWYSDYISAADRRTYYQYEYPKQDEIQPAQKTYIKNYIKQFERSLFYNDFESENGFRQLADESSFVDFMIINELSKNVDGYRISTYLHKDKNEKLKIGPVWDFNLAFGNADYYMGAVTSGFQFQTNIGQDNSQVPFWWQILFDDNTYRKNLKNRWNDLRQDELSNDRIDFVIDSLTTLLLDAQQRNFYRWPILDVYVWPNAFVGNSYAAEISWLENWIDGRMAWLDNSIDNLYVGIDEIDQLADVSIFPNPFNDELRIQFIERLDSKIHLEVYNAQGMMVMSNNDFVIGNQLIVGSDKLTRLNPGIYFVKVSDETQVLLSDKLIKR